MIFKTIILAALVLFSIDYYRLRKFNVLMSNLVTSDHFMTKNERGNFLRKDALHEGFNYIIVVKP